MNDILVTGRKFLPQEGNSCQRKEIPFTGRKFLLKEEKSCNKREIAVTGRKSLWQGNYMREIWQRKEISGEGRISLKEMTIPLKFKKNLEGNMVLVLNFCWRRKFLVEERTVACRICLRHFFLEIFVVKKILHSILNTPEVNTLYRIIFIQAFL